jgi:hypothetical protein
MRQFSLLFLLFSASSLFGHKDSLRQLHEAAGYFHKIAVLDFHKTDFMKWKKDIKIYLHSNDDAKNMDTNTAFQADYLALKMELKQIVNELNELINTINIVFVDKKEESNMEIFIGSANECQTLDALTRFTIQKNWAIQHCQVTTDGNEIIQSFVFLDLYRTPNIRMKKTLLRKKITQSLGLFNELEDNKESIFYAGFSEQFEFTNLDKEVIRMLYSTCLK